MVAKIDREGKIDYSIYNLLITTTVTRNMDVLRDALPKVVM